MNIQDYKKENDALRQRVAELEKANNELIVHNIQLGRKVDTYYDVASKGVVNDVKVRMGTSLDAATTNISTGDAKLN